MAKTDRPEHRLSHWCIELLDRIMVGDCPRWWTAVDTGTEILKKTPEARMAWEAHRRYMGIKPHHLDIYIYQYPLFSQIELKYEKTHAAAARAITTGQADTFVALRQADVMPGFAWSIRSFYAELIRIGFRLHGNAENIVTEIEARYAAAQEAADIKMAKPYKPSAKPRAKKPSIRQVTRGNRMARVGM